jgi:uncharacterized protein
MVSRRPFRNRANELELLQRRWDSAKAQIFTLWGRRRVGKSALLLRFAEGKRHLYFEATSGTARTSSPTSPITCPRRPGGPPCRRRVGARRSTRSPTGPARGPVLVVLDEFQHMAIEQRDIGSTINVWWRERGEGPPIFLVLCGSEVGLSDGLLHEEARLLA